MGKNRARKKQIGQEWRRKEDRSSKEGEQSIKKEGGEDSGGPSRNLPVKDSGFSSSIDSSQKTQQEEEAASGEESGGPSRTLPDKDSGGSASGEWSGGPSRILPVKYPGGSSSLIDASQRNQPEPEVEAPCDADILDGILRYKRRKKRFPFGNTTDWGDLFKEELKAACSVEEMSSVIRRLKNNYRVRKLNVNFCNLKTHEQEEFNLATLIWGATADGRNNENGVGQEKDLSKYPLLKDALMKNAKMIEEKYEFTEAGPTYLSWKEMVKFEQAWGKVLIQETEMILEHKRLCVDSIRSLSFDLYRESEGKVNSVALDSEHNLIGSDDYSLKNMKMEGVEGSAIVNLEGHSDEASDVLILEAIVHCKDRKREFPFGNTTQLQDWFKKKSGKDCPVEEILDVLEQLRNNYDMNKSNVNLSSDEKKEFDLANQIWGTREIDFSEYNDLSRSVEERSELNEFIWKEGLKCMSRSKMAELDMKWKDLRQLEAAFRTELLYSMEGLSGFEILLGFINYKHKTGRYPFDNTKDLQECFHNELKACWSVHKMGVVVQFLKNGYKVTKVCRNNHVSSHDELQEFLLANMIWGSEKLDGPGVGEEKDLSKYPHLKVAFRRHREWKKGIGMDGLKYLNWSKMEELDSRWRDMMAHEVDVALEHESLCLEAIKLFHH